jgi:hypothetical protein
MPARRSFTIIATTFACVVESATAFWMSLIASPMKHTSRFAAFAMMSASMRANMPVVVSEPIAALNTSTIRPPDSRIVCVYHDFGPA